MSPGVIIFSLLMSYPRRGCCCRVFFLRRGYSRPPATGRVGQGLAASAVAGLGRAGRLYNPLLQKRIMVFLCPTLGAPTYGSCCYKAGEESIRSCCCEAGEGSSPRFGWRRFGRLGLGDPPPRRLLQPISARGGVHPPIGSTFFGGVYHPRG